MSVKITRTGEGRGAQYGMEYRLPMSGANVPESEHCAMSLMEAANAQLDFAGSKHRFVILPIDAKEQAQTEDSPACDNCFNPMDREGDHWHCPHCGNRALAEEGGGS